MNINLDYFYRFGDGLTLEEARLTELNNIVGLGRNDVTISNPFLSSLQDGNNLAAQEEEDDDGLEENEGSGHDWVQSAR